MKKEQTCPLTLSPLKKSGWLCAGILQIHVKVVIRRIVHEDLQKLDEIVALK